MALTLADSPGKLEGELAVTRLAWDLGLYGFSDGECGAHVLMRGGADLIAAREETGLEVVLNVEDEAFLRAQAGVILREDDSGFVWGAWYETRGALDAEWDRIEGEYAEASLEAHLY